MQSDEGNTLGNAESHTVTIPDRHAMKGDNMKAIDKVTKREHAICPVLGGFQVCLIPNVAWEDAKAENIHVFMNKEFYIRFDLKEEI